MGNEFIAGAESIGLDERSLYLRRLIVRALEGGKRGHLGSSMSLVEILRAAFDDYLRYRPDDDSWPDRDRFILSKGHGCLALYGLLADKGYFPLEELDGFCARDSKLGGHPEASKVPGVEASTGALGHGLPIGVGMALAGRIRGKEHRVMVVVGDGEINEGSTWEAAMCAAKHRLQQLVVCIDYNKLQSYGDTEYVSGLEPLLDKWRSFGFGVREVNGHDVEGLRQVFNALPLEKERPSAVICHTVKGKGLPYAEGRAEWHHKSRLSLEDINDMYKALEAGS
jgi:transketolase